MNGSQQLRHVKNVLIKCVIYPKVQIQDEGLDLNRLHLGIDALPDRISSLYF